MRIGVDLDNTISNTNEFLIEEILKYDLEVLGNKGIKNNQAYKFTDMFYISENEYKYFVDNYFPKLILKIPVKPHSSEVLKKLHDEGNEIYIITHRDHKEFKNPYKITSKWLKKNKFVYDKLIVDSGDKGNVALKEGIDIFIDDLPKNCESIQKHGTKVLMFNAYYNFTETRFKRVISWEEIYNIIRKEH